MSYLDRIGAGAVIFSIAYGVGVLCSRLPFLFPTRYSYLALERNLWFLGMVFQFIPIVSTLFWLQARVKMIDPEGQRS